MTLYKLHQRPFKLPYRQCPRVYAGHRIHVLHILVCLHSLPWITYGRTRVHYEFFAPLSPSAFFTLHTHTLPSFLSSSKVKNAKVKKRRKEARASEREENKQQSMQMTCMTFLLDFLQKFSLHSPLPLMYTEWLSENESEKNLRTNTQTNKSERDFICLSHCLSGFLFLPLKKKFQSTFYRQMVWIRFTQKWTRTNFSLIIWRKI